MAPAILATKLFIPPVGTTVVPRPHLIERLDECLTRKLTLVSAPAGFGKTALLSEWARQREIPAAWLSLDDSDNDAARFLAYVVAAVNTLSPAIDHTILSELHLPQPQSVEQLLHLLVNQLAGINNHFVLILDDYHVIQTPSIHDSLIFLLDHLPPRMHVIIATRADPPLPLSRLRGSGQLIELRAADLRFTLEEVKCFLDRATRLSLSEEDVAALASYTEGWIAGLQLATITMQGRKDVSGFIHSFTGSNRYILDYLGEEVLQHQPENIQTFLLQTSVLDRFSSSLCDAVTERRDSQIMLENIERANLFVVPMDDERSWYRYHRLFADLLVKRLHQMQPDQVSELHRRASVWYELHDSLPEAIEHALLAGDHERAGHLIETITESMWGRGEHATLLRWLNTLPDPLVHSWPQLCIVQALAFFMAGRFEETDRHLQTAEHLLNLSPGECSNFYSDGKLSHQEQAGMIATVRALMASFKGDTLTVVQCARQALQFLPERNTLWRSNAAVALGNAYMLRWEWPAAHQAFAQAHTAGKTTGNFYQMLLAAVKMATVQVYQGQLQQPLAICQQYAQRLNEVGVPQVAIAGSLFAVYADILREQNHLDEALLQVNRSIEISEQANHIAGSMVGYLTLAKILLSKGDWSGVDEAIHHFDRLAPPNDVIPIWIIGSGVYWKTRAWITQERLGAVEQLFQEFAVGDQDRGVESDGMYPEFGKDLAFIHWLIAQRELERAAARLERMHRVAASTGSIWFEIEVSILQALVFHAQGDGERAMMVLKHALSLAEPEGFFRMFVDRGFWMPALLYEAAARGIAPEYTGRLLAALPISENTTPRRHSQIVEPLSEREMEIVRLMAAGASNPEIAQQLVIATSTVKKHVNHIFGKLSVTSRIQAVARARQLGLLE
jgi:LuxR family maltose regulon positive regulatory protein